VLFLTLGSEALCRVQLEVHKGRGTIKASISGPPNGFERSRREYALGPSDQEYDPDEPASPVAPVFGARPEQIAEEIVTAILVGKFE
jgi:hypothetical protein